MRFNYTKTTDGPYQIFHPEAFQANIGKTIDFNVEGHDTIEATVIDAVVHKAGCCVDLTLEIPEGPIAEKLRSDMAKAVSNGVRGDASND